MDDCKKILDNGHAIVLWKNDMGSMYECRLEHPPTPNLGLNNGLENERINVHVLQAPSIRPILDRTDLSASGVYSGRHFVAEPSWAHYTARLPGVLRKVTSDGDRTQ